MSKLLHSNHHRHLARPENEVIAMSRSLKIGALIGAALSLIFIPAGLGEALPVLIPFFIAVGGLTAGILKFFVRMNITKAQALPVKTDLTFLEHFFYTSLLVMIIVFGLIPTINEARESARRSPCKNNLYNFSHACRGEFVILDQEGQIDRISSCPVCDQMRRRSSVGSDFVRISFYDAVGRQLSDDEVPAEILQEAKQRLSAISSDRDDDDD
jgi:hypothetical protein